MKFPKERPHTMPSIMGLWAMLALLVFMAACSQSTATAPPATAPELTALMERAAIEDLFNDYYAQFGPDGQHNFTAYFTADGILEVNGLVAKGSQQ